MGCVVASWRTAFHRIALMFSFGATQYLALSFLPNFEFTPIMKMLGL